MKEINLTQDNLKCELQLNYIKPDFFTPKLKLSKLTEKNEQELLLCTNQWIIERQFKPRGAQTSSSDRLFLFTLRRKIVKQSKGTLSNL